LEKAVFKVPQLNIERLKRMSMQIDIAPFLLHLVDGSTTVNARGTTADDCITDLVKDVAKVQNIRV
jgi:hypothetical protein